jgi:uncharacterized protein (UPF0333 family)
MRRGQAFETMMLVISVIVALAILAVLMNIIGGITGIGQGQPDKIMHDALKEMVQKGYGYSQPQEAVIKKATIIDSKQVVGTDNPGLNPLEVQFLITGITALELPRTPNKIGPASTDIKLFIVVCGDATKGEQGKYRISIAKSAIAASNGCVIPTT